MSVLLTVNIVSHNAALSKHGAVLIIFHLNLQTITITRMLSSRGEGKSMLGKLGSNDSDTEQRQNWGFELRVVLDPNPESLLYL